MITDDMIAETATFNNLHVNAANISGTLTADQIDATDLKVSAANISGKLTANQITAEGGSLGCINFDTNGGISIGDYFSIDCDGVATFENVNITLDSGDTLDVEKILTSTSITGIDWGTEGSDNVLYIDA